MSDLLAARYQVLCIIYVPLAIVASYMVVDDCMSRRSASRVAASSLAFAVLTVLAWGMAWVRDAWRLNKALGVFPGVVTGLPTVLLGVVALFAAAFELVWLASLRQQKRAHITPDSIKEAFDALPDAACFAGRDGAPLLVNVQMDALAHDAFGGPVANERVLWERLCKGDVSPGFAVSNARAEQGHALLVDPVGRAWEFSRRELPLARGTVTEVVAADVTREYVLVRELSERNERLRQINERLRTYGADMARLVREEEVLAAKLRVHNEMGRALVALRAYERQPVGERDREALLDLWWKAIRLLKTSVLDEDEAEGAWDKLEQAAQAIDVRLSLTGVLPAAGPAQEVLMAVVHECLNNAVRHADAHEVQVELAYEGPWLVGRVTNDGIPPAGTVPEAGGLANLRRQVEGAGGTMRVTWQPRFVVEVRLIAEVGQ